MAKPIKILFVCTGNSARSQMAEGFARYYGGDAVQAESAGTHPKGIHPYTVWAMNEAGIDISHHTSDSLSAKELPSYDYIITLCGDARDTCPPLPPNVQTEHWPIPDPAQIRGNPLERIAGFRVVRYHVERRVKDLLRRTLQSERRRSA